MSIVRKLLGLKPARPEPAKVENVEGPRHDQLSVDVAIASQVNNQTAARVRETLAQFLEQTERRAFK